MLEVMVLADYKSLYLKLPDFKSVRTFLAFSDHGDVDYGDGVFESYFPIFRMTLPLILCFT